MLKIRTATGAGVAAFAIGATTLFGGTAIANAAPKDQTKVSTQAHKHTDRVTGDEAQNRKDKGGRERVAITADEKSSAEAAALAEVPGATVDHVHKKKDGTYVVEIRTADGKKQIVKLDGSFAVTGVDDAVKKHGKGRH